MATTATLVSMRFLAGGPKGVVIEGDFSVVTTSQEAWKVPVRVFIAPEEMPRGIGLLWRQFAQVSQDLAEAARNTAQAYAPEGPAAPEPAQPPPDA